MATKFGNTWWGEAWLNSLCNIDYENRIPRGASYARKGAVTSLKVKDNIISAKVQGSRRTPYKVMIVLPKFIQEDIDRFIDSLIVRPALITELFQRQLSPEVAQLAVKCGLKLFPQKWSDLKMNCNCPDWAVPCKHIAAVIYMFSREIDNNPFIVFEMHGVDLIKELKNHGVDLESNVKEIAPREVRSMLARSKAVKTTRKEANSFVPRIDFTRLAPLADSNMNLLPDAPAFYVNGNFKEIYTQELNRCMKSAERFLSGKLKKEGLLRTPVDTVSITQGTVASLTVDDKLAVAVGLTDDESHKEIGIDALIKALLDINPDFLPDYDLSVAALHTALYTAIHLVANGLIKPEIVKADQAYRIMWMPLPSDARINEIIDGMESLLPEGTLTATAKGRQKTVHIDNPARILVALLAGRLIGSLSLAKSNDGITDIFFRDGATVFDGIGQKEIPGAIKSWTDRLVLTGDVWQPVLYVADSDDDNDVEFTITVSVVNTATDSHETIPLGQVLTSPRLENARFEILQSVMRLRGILPDLTEYINGGAFEPMPLQGDALVEFIINIIPSMRALGLKVFLPKSLQHLLRPKASLRISEKKKEPGMFTMFDFFTYDWRISVGDELVSVEDFNAMIEKARGLIRIKKSYIYVSPADLEKIRSRISMVDALSPVQLFQAAVSEEYDSAPVELTPGVRAMIDEIRHYSDVALPEGLNATLRPYQVRGYSWLYRNMKIGFGSILADDMGLGKTLQSIAVMLKMKQDGVLGKDRVLVVAPVGLLYNWEAEIHRFAPELRTHIYHGTFRNIKDADNADVVLTSYGSVRNDLAKLKKCRWKLMVIDEAQNIKNPKTEQTKAICQIDADYRIALSGTPVENRLSEFWSIMNFANRGYLGKLNDFTKDYAKPIQVYNDTGCAEELKKITAPFMLRRLKTDKSIISDLPDKTERNLYASLSPQQAALYEQTLSEAMAIIQGLSVNDKKDLFKRQGIILQMIMALKQICDHPALFLKNGDCDVALSGKAQMLVDRVREIVESNGKVLIFTQYKEMGAMLEDLLEKELGQRPLFYHGGCTVNERKSMVDKFQNGRVHRIFILSLKAGGTGLNLTAANNVIHYDLWWNPAVEAQATDRAYRIGQKSNVMVDRFITTGTFEEKINEMINAKRHLAEMTVSTGETWIGNLSNKELQEIFERS